MPRNKTEDGTQYDFDSIKLMNITLMNITVVNEYNVNKINVTPTNVSRVFHVEVTWNDHFHVVSTWNTRGVYIGIRFSVQMVSSFCN